jgi:hypothetical protein
MTLFQRVEEFSKNNPVAPDCSRTKEFALTGLSSEVGNLTKLCQSRQSGDVKEAFCNSTAMILWYLANISGAMDLDFNTVGEEGFSRMVSLFEKRG